MQIVHVAVEGTIGAGKTTVLKILQEQMPDAKVIEEPVGDWMRLGLLGRAYNHPERFALGFQQAVMVSLFHAYHQERDALVVISERSFFSNKHVFSNLHLDAEQWPFYAYAHDLLTKMLPERRLMYVYIETPVHEALRRIRQRGRKEEDAIDQDYLMKVQEAHESWLRSESNVVRIDGTQAPEKIASQIRAAVVSKILGKETFT